MSDIIDEASATEALYLADALARQQKSATRLQHTGKCHWCEADIDTGIFCDADCAADHEYEQKIRSKQYAS